MAHDAMVEEPGHGRAEPLHEEEAHATNKTYVQVAIILAVITLVEVVIYYLPAVRGVLVPALIVLSLAKFAMVVGFFMHLKYDNRLYRFMFVAGLIVSLSVYLALLAMFLTSESWQAFTGA
jgi:cytochrome c oxidase subunit 4